MQLIQDGSQGPATVPAKQAAVGTPGYAWGGPPGTTPASDWGPDLANTIMAELIAIATANGGALDPTNNVQCLAQIRAMSATNFTGVAASCSLPALTAGIVDVSAAAGNVVITLPLSAGLGGKPYRYKFFRTDTTANTVTINLAAGDALQPGGATSFTLASGALTSIEADGFASWLTAPVYRGNAISVATASDSFIVPSGVMRVKVRVLGAGGGSGGSTNAAGSTGGGGAGGYAEGIYTVTPGQVIARTIGAAGVGGTGGGAGTAGGTTSFGSLCSATGGNGSAGMTTASAWQGAAGGTGVGGAVNGTGMPGNNATPNLGGNGGSSFAGGGGLENGGSGGTATGYGAGGGGVAGVFVGNSGSSGLIIVEY